VPAEVYLCNVNGWVRFSTPLHTPARTFDACRCRFPKVTSRTC